MVSNITIPYGVKLGGVPFLFKRGGLNLDDHIIIQDFMMQRMRIVARMFNPILHWKQQSRKLYTKRENMNIITYINIEIILFKY